MVSTANSSFSVLTAKFFFVLFFLRVMTFWTEVQSSSTRVRCLGSISLMAGVSSESSSFLIISWCCAKRYMNYGYN